MRKYSFLKVLGKFSVCTALSFKSNVSLSLFLLLLLLLFEIGSYCIDQAGLRFRDPPIPARIKGVSHHAHLKFSHFESHYFPSVISANPEV